MGQSSPNGRGSWWPVVATSLLLLAVVSVAAGAYTFLLFKDVRAVPAWLMLKVGGEHEVCNATAPLLTVAHSKWNLDPLWQSTCEEKNRDRFSWQYPAGRNWCWMGLKSKCHAHLKDHFSWGHIRELAAKDGLTPPESAAPFAPLANPEVCDRPGNGAFRRWTLEDRGEAKTWFQRYVQVYVLNLKTDRERWLSISTRLSELSIQAVRIDGVDMRAEDAYKQAVDEGLIPTEYNFSHAQKMAETYKQKMGGVVGTLGCASAHFKAQTRIVADGWPLAVVFEDDVRPEDDFVERLWSLVHEELPCDWEVLSLYSRCPYGTCVSQHLARVNPDTNEPLWRCRQGVNWGMQGVLYRGSTLAAAQEKWKRAVFDAERPHCLDVDVALASISDQVGVYAVPSGQAPGFLTETNQRSARWSINMAGGRPSTAVHQPVKIGMPFPSQIKEA